MVRHNRRSTLVFLVIVFLVFVGQAWAQDGETATEAANRQAVSAWLAALSDPAAATGPMALVTDDDALKDHLMLLESAFPGFSLDVDEMIVEGDSVAVRMTFHGAQHGAYSGIPPTGQTVEVPVALFIHLDHGQVVDRWMQGDLLGLLADLEHGLLFNSTLWASNDAPAHDCGSLLPVKHMH